MVEVKDDCLSIGDGDCSGVSTVRGVGQILCSFNNKGIALYDFSTQRFVKNWQLNVVTDRLTTLACYDQTNQCFRAVKNDNELIEWKNETELASEFTVVKLKFNVHSFLTTPTSCIIVYENGYMELMNSYKVLSKGRNTNVFLVSYCETHHVIVICQLISQSYYHFTFYDFNDTNQEMTELNTITDLSTDTLGDLIAMKTSGPFLLTAWSSGVIVKSKLDSTDYFSLDNHLVTLESSVNLLAFTNINNDCFTLLTDTKELRVYNVHYGTLQFTLNISQNISLSENKITCCNGYIFLHLPSGLCGYPLVISEQMTLATAVGKTKKSNKLCSYQWNEDNITESSDHQEGLLELRKLIKKGSSTDWSTDVKLLCQLTSLVESLLHQEVLPHKELLAILKAKIFPVNLIPLLLERCMKQVDWVLIVTVLKCTEGLPEESLVELLISVLELDDDEVIKLSKKQTCTKSELLFLLLSRFKNDSRLQQPLTNLSHNHVLTLLELLSVQLDDMTLTATSPSSSSLSYSDALEWFGLLIDTHFTRLIMVPHIRPLLLELKKTFYRHSRYLSYLGTICELVQIGRSMTRDKCHDSQWNYKVESINLTV